MRESITKFGSLREMAKVLQNETYRKVFNEFIKTPKKNQGVKEKNGLGIVLKTDRRYLDFPSLQKVINNNDESENFVDLFVQKDILHRGLILKCEKCRNTDWYAIDDLTKHFRCKRCSREQRYNTQHWKLRNATGEPPWYYKLDEVVYQGYLNCMFVPILTLNRLLNVSKNSFIFIPEIEVRKDPSSVKPDFEIDICCVKDGTLILGECKKEAEITLKEINKYKEIGTKIGTNEIIFSTFAEKWSEDKIQEIQKLFSNTEIEVKFYCQHDLLS